MIKRRAGGFAKRKRQRNDQRAGMRPGRMIGIIVKMRVRAKRIRRDSFGQHRDRAVGPDARGAGTRGDRRHRGAHRPICTLLARHQGERHDVEHARGRAFGHFWREGLIHAARNESAESLGRIHRSLFDWRMIFSENRYPLFGIMR
jgi:hypothetical protein